MQQNTLLLGHHGFLSLFLPSYVQSARVVSFFVC